MTLKKARKPYSFTIQKTIKSTPQSENWQLKGKKEAIIQ